MQAIVRPLAKGLKSESQDLRIAGRERDRIFKAGPVSRPKGHSFRKFAAKYAEICGFLVCECELSRTASDKKARFVCHIVEAESAQEEAVANNKAHKARSEVYV